MITPRSVLRVVSDRLRVWWKGKHSPPKNRDSGLVFLNHYRRHWTSGAAHVALDYFKAHHQWIIGIAVAIVLAVVAVKTK
jgi:hypothetical protein